MEAQQVTLPRKRRRPALSCEQCRRRKLKCDRTNPCNQCTKSKIPRCTFSSEYRASWDPYPQEHEADGSHLLSPPSTVGEARGSHQQQSYPVTGRAREAPDDFFTPTDKATLIQSDTATLETDGRACPVPGGTVYHAVSATTGSEAVDKVLRDEAEELPHTKGAQSTHHDVPFVPSTDESIVAEGPPKATYGKTRYFGQSHWMNTLQEFSTLAMLKSKLETQNDSQLVVMIEKCKRLARVLKKPAIQIANFQDVRYMVNTKDNHDRLVDNYFRTFESTYRILHVPTFRREYDRYWENPDKASPEFVIKLLLVSAIGTAFSPEAAVIRPCAIQWVHGAQSYLVSPNEKSRLTINGLQIHCLLLLARQINAVGGDLVWLSAGSLLRTAMHMGLHRDPQYLPKSSVYASEMRKRLWATILELTVESSLDSGGPAMITPNDYDCSPPSNLDDTDFDENTKSLPPIKPISTYTQTSLQILLHKSLPSRLQAIRILNDFRSAANYDQVLALGRTISTQATSISTLYPPTSTSPGPTVFHRRLVDMLLYYIVIALHQPFRVRSKADTRYYYSRQLTSKISLFLLSTCPPYQPAHYPADDDWTRLMYYSSGVYRSIPLHCAKLVCAEVISELQDDTSLPGFDDGRQRDLQAAMHGYVDTLAKRLQTGETNVKGYVFFSCMIGQVEAMKSGGNVEERMIEAVTRGLERCYGWLKDRAGEASARKVEEMERLGVLDEGVGSVGEGDGEGQGEDGLDWDKMLPTDMDLGFTDSWLFWNHLPVDGSVGMMTPGFT